MTTKIAEKMMDVQLKIGEQIDKFMSDIPLNLFGKHDFFIGIRKNINWDKLDPYGMYELSVPDEYNMLHTVLTAIITKNTYKITTYTLFYDDKIIDGIDDIKNKLEAYFGILGLVEDRNER